MFTSLLVQEEFWPVFVLFSPGFLSSGCEDFLWSILTPLGTSATLILWNVVAKCVYARYIKRLRAKPPSWDRGGFAECPLDKVPVPHEGKCSTDAVASGGKLQHCRVSKGCSVGLVVWGWKSSFHSLPGCLNYIRVAHCWKYFPVCVALMDLALSSLSRLTLCPHPLPFYLSSLLHKRRIFIFQAAFYPL